MSEKELIIWIKGYCTAVLQIAGDTDKNSGTTKFLQPIIDRIKEYDQNGVYTKQLLTDSKVWNSTTTQPAVIKSEK
jgi:hypothetical protein